MHYTGPINREMRNLITSLKNHNEQLKGEVARYKRKLKEAQGEISKVCHYESYQIEINVHFILFQTQQTILPLLL